MTQRNGMLTTLCIIAGVLGMLGLLGVLIAGGSLLFQDRIQQGQLRQQQALPPELQENQQKIIKDINKVGEKWKIFSYGSLVGKTGVCLLLLLGGAMAFLMRRGGRTLLMAAFVAGLVLEGLLLIPTFLMQKEIMDITTKSMENIAGQGGGQQADAVVQASMKIGMAVGLFLVFGWFALKIFFYGFGTYYMKRSDVVALYEGRNPRDEFDDSFE